MANKARPLFNDAAFGSGSPSTTFLMDSMDDGVAFVFQAGRTAADNVAYLGAVLNVTAGAPTLRFGIETVTAGAPSGTYVAGGAGYIVVTPAGATPTMYFADMSALPALALTPGTYYAFTIRAHSILVAVNTCTVTHLAGSQGTPAIPFVSTMTNGGAWTSATGRPQGCILYESNGDLTNVNELGFASIDSYALNNATQNIDSGSTPDEVGLTWTQQENDYCAGAQVFMLHQNTSSTWDLVLYEDGTAIKTVAVNPANIRLITTAQLFIPFSASPGFPGVPLVAGRVYILAVRPATANYVRLGGITFPNDPDGGTPDRLRDDNFGHAWRTSRTNAGAWTPLTGSVPLIVPWLTSANGGDADSLVASGGGFWGA